MAELTEEEFLKQYSPQGKVSEEEAFLNQYAPTSSTRNGQVIVEPSPLTGKQGELVIQSQPFAAISRGILNSMLAGSPEALAQRGGVAQNFDPSSPQFTNPLTYTIGESLGSLLPFGRAAAGAKTLGGLALRGLGSGALYGGVQGASEEIANPESTASDTLNSALLGSIKGGAVGAAFPVVASTPRLLANAPQAIGGSISRAVARVKPTSTQSAISALKFTEQEAENILPGAVPRLSKASGKATPTTAEVLEAAPKARQTAFDETTIGLTKAKDEGLVAKGSSLFDDVSNAIQSDLRLMEDDPQAAQALISRYQKYNREIDPIEARKLLESTNDKLISHFDKSAKRQAVDMTDAELRAERAFASNLSQQVDDLYKVGSGKIDSPYRDIGRVIEFEKNLKIEDEAGKLAFAERVAPTRQRGGSSLPSGKVQTARMAGRGLTTMFKITEPELLDKRVKEIFRGVSKEAPPLELPPDAIQEGLDSLRLQYSASTIPSVVRVPQASVQPLSLESQIQNLISTYPARLRNDPAMARLAAEAQLRGSFTPPQ